ncbi:MAG TPA: SGNH/GDSL hydrolase family protein [Flavisolibacter sp.]|nr:SGNH/GDSL hydrolase family protein [Flavisolibacter sp.]
MKKQCFHLIALLLSVLAYGQKKIVVLGSSTAAGSGASPADSSWVNRLKSSFNRNTNDGVDTTIVNLAIGGYTSYHIMPTDFPVPPGRPAPNVTQNITKAISLLPNVIIINMPSNDIGNGYTMKEQMDNLRLLFQQAMSHGIRCFIGTTQPRNFADAAQRQMQRELVDSITNNFASYAINFWDDLVSNDGQNRIRDDVNWGDGVHINNAGHRHLFERTAAKSLLTASAPLPLRLSGFKVREENKRVQLSWATAEEEPGSFFEIERSADGLSFVRLDGMPAKGYQPSSYQWTDPRPLEGKSFYRLKLVSAGRINYSGIVGLSIAARPLLIQRLYHQGGELCLEISSLQEGQVSIDILSSTGALLLRRSFGSGPQAAMVRLSLPPLATGNYFARISSRNGATDIRPFFLSR